MMSITASHWHRISWLLDQALDLEPASREPWLQSLEPEHQDLRELLQELLAGGSSETSDVLQRLPEFTALPIASVAAGNVIGPYRLIREVGRGGMAAVWLAERADGSLQRKVALKMPHLAWTDPDYAGRAMRESDLLAALEHPNIARLYDAGIDDLGRPYLALEFVDGVPLDAYCNAHSPTLRQRLDLFLQVGCAVAFAHERLIVHRDLKPSNVLVRSDGKVRLLDFGIARLLQGEFEQATPTTQFAGRVLTPRYAAPEQFTDRDITVAADVYSLGVLLYEMLAGVSPYGPQTVSTASLQEAVMKQEPALPSMVSRIVPARALRGDLDDIIAKALKKYPLHRYASVELFLIDIERHLAGHPVAARPASTWYRAQKFVRRNSSPLCAAMVTLLALVMGFLAGRYLTTNHADASRAAHAVVSEMRVARGQSSAEKSRMTLVNVRIAVRTSSWLLEGFAWS